MFCSSDKGGSHGGIFFELGAEFVIKLQARFLFCFVLKKALPIAFPEGQRVEK